MELDKNHAHFKLKDPDRIAELDALDIDLHETGPFDVLALHDVIKSRLSMVSSDRYTGDNSSETLGRMGILRDLQSRVDSYITEHLQ